MPIRTALDADLDSVATICAQALRADGEEASCLPRLLWDSPRGKPDLRLVAEDDHGIAGVVLAALRVQRDSPPAGHIDLLAVAPRAQGQGYGRRLLTAGEANLKLAGAVEVRLGGNAPCYAWPGIDVNYTAAIRLAQSAGYEPWGEAFNMSVDLTNAALDTALEEKRLRDNAISIRRLEASDEPRFSSWVGEHWTQEWAWEASRALVRKGAGCYVATRGSGLLAFAAHGCLRPSWFGPMGTAPAEQRQGLGAVLLKRCLTEQRSAGMTRSTIGWVGPAKFYERSVGATMDRLFRLYRKPL